jgi:ubiquitin carboxyl-terminal hydrolase 47
MVNSVNCNTISTTTATSSNFNINYTDNSFTCIITDLTNASNTCKRHVINLSGSYKLDHLIQEAAQFYSYDPFTFNLMWNSSPNGELVNLSEFQNNDVSLDELGLHSNNQRNMFEIHEKEGPPKKIKILGQQNDDEEEAAETVTKLKSTNEGDDNNCSYQQQRRNACVDQSVITSNSNDSDLPEYGPPNSSSNIAQASSSIIQTCFDDDSTGYVGLINQAMTCYLNSLLQALYMTPEFRNAIYRWKPNQEILNNEEIMRKSIPYQLQRLFLNLQTSKKKSIHTQNLTKSFGWNSDDAFQQHDVQELCRVMFDALEKTFKNTKQNNLINELYQGKIKDYVKCLECMNESAREDVYSDVPLCIRPFGSEKLFESIEEAMDAFVQPEILDDNNKYFCSNCQRACKAHKGLKFVSFPYILSLQLKRFDFDYRTLSRFKLSNKVSFPEKLSLDKYLIENNQNAHEQISENNIEYELFSIMIHSGSATGGHYYAYIKCFETNQWLNFNDERVSKLDRDDIKKAYGTSFSSYSSTTAYMLLYRQINPQRNQNFIQVEEFDDHLKQLLEKEREQQLEADRLKEYMDNVCKIKVLVPSLGQENWVSSQREKVVDVHKDLTLNKAKDVIVKVKQITIISFYSI